MKSVAVAFLVSLFVLVIFVLGWFAGEMHEQNEVDEWQKSAIHGLEVGAQVVQELESCRQARLAHLTKVQ